MSLSPWNMRRWEVSRHKLSNTAESVCSSWVTYCVDEIINCAFHSARSISLCYLVPSRHLESWTVWIYNPIYRFFNTLTSTYSLCEGIILLQHLDHQYLVPSVGSFFGCQKGQRVRHALCFCNKVGVPSYDFKCNVFEDESLVAG